MGISNQNQDLSTIVIANLAEESKHGEEFHKWQAGYERALAEVVYEDYGDPLRKERILRTRDNGSETEFFTTNGTRFIPLPKRYGNKEYLEYLQENSSDNPVDSYVVICNHNPHDFKVLDTKNYNFGHTWLQLNVGGEKNYQIQYYSSPNQLGNVVKSASGKVLDGAAMGYAVSEIADGVLSLFLDKKLARAIAGGAGVVAGIGNAAVNTVYKTAVNAKVIEDTAQLSFHNALVIPIRRRAAEVMAVDAIIDSKGYTSRYNFTNTRSKENPRTGNCTRDSLLRLNEVGIPITEAVLSITPKDERGALQDFWSRLWQVRLRPGLLSRAFRTLEAESEYDEVTVQDKIRQKKHNSGDGKGKTTTFTFRQCTMSGDSVKNMPVLLIENQIGKGEPPPTWHNLSDVLIQYARQKCKGIVAGKVVDLDEEGDVRGYIASLMPIAFVENGMDNQYQPGSIGALQRRSRSADERGEVYPHAIR